MLKVTPLWKCMALADQAKSLWKQRHLTSLQLSTDLQELDARAQWLAGNIKVMYPLIEMSLRSVLDMLVVKVFGTVSSTEVLTWEGAVQSREHS